MTQPELRVIELAHLVPGDRVWLDAQHEIFPQGFTTHTDHEVIRLFRWMSGELQGVTLRPWERDGPQVFVPAHHVVLVKIYPTARRTQ